MAEPQCNNHLFIKNWFDALSVKQNSDPAELWNLFYFLYICWTQLLCGIQMHFYPMCLKKQKNCDDDWSWNHPQKYAPTEKEEDITVWPFDWQVISENFSIETTQVETKTPMDLTNYHLTST